jgi:hypothetical protein
MDALVFDRFAAVLFIDHLGPKTFTNIYRDLEPQYAPDAVDRELRKAFCAFFVSAGDLQAHTPIATGAIDFFAIIWKNLKLTC